MKKLSKDKYNHLRFLFYLPFKIKKIKTLTNFKSNFYLFIFAFTKNLFKSYIFSSSL